MGPPFYDSLISSNIISISCSKEEHLDEVTQVEPELNTIWDEEISATSYRDVEHITYEDPFEAKNEEWLNPFATIIEDENLPNFADSFHMHMAHYDEKFQDLGPRISGDSSMISLTYSSCGREACRIEDSIADMQCMMSLGYHSQMFPLITMEEVVQPDLPYFGNVIPRF